MFSLLIHQNQTPIWASDEFRGDKSDSVISSTTFIFLIAHPTFRRTPHTLLNHVSCKCGFAFTPG